MTANPYESPQTEPVPSKRDKFWLEFNVSFVVGAIIGICVVRALRACGWI